MTVNVNWIYTSVRFSFIESTIQLFTPRLSCNTQKSSSWCLLKTAGTNARRMIIIAADFLSSINLSAEGDLPKLL